MRECPGSDARARARRVPSILLAILALGAACESSVGPEEAIQQYALVEVDGRPLPRAHPGPADEVIFLVADTLTLRGGREGTRAMHFEVSVAAPGGPAVEQTRWELRVRIVETPTLPTFLEGGCTVPLECGDPVPSRMQRDGARLIVFAANGRRLYRRVR